MRFSGTSGWPFFTENNTNRMWNDPRLMMGQYQHPFSSYSFRRPPERVVEIPVRHEMGPEKTVEIPVTHEMEPESTSQKKLHHQQCTENGNDFQTRGKSPTPPQKRRQLSASRKCDDVWQIPVQIVDQNKMPPSPQQQSPKCSQKQAGPNSSRASPNPVTNVHKSPHASRKSDVAKTVPQSAEKSQPQTNCPPEPTPECTESEPTPAVPQQQDKQPEQSSQPEMSPEEKAFEIINGVMGEVKGLEEQIGAFQGVKKDKPYRYLEEMLTRGLLKLDSVESGSNDTVRQARKQAVRHIETAINLLENKAAASETSSIPTNSDSTSSSDCSIPTSEQMDTTPETAKEADVNSLDSAEQMNVDPREQDISVDSLK